MEISKSLLCLTIVLTLCVTLGQGHIVYDKETSQIVAQRLDLEKFFQLQGEINEITADIEPLKGLSLEVKKGIKKLFFILNNLIEFFDTHFQYKCPDGTCKVGKKCLYLWNNRMSLPWENARNVCGNRGGRLYQPSLPPYFPNFVKDLVNSCPDLLEAPVWIDASLDGSSNEFVYPNGCIIPNTLIETNVPMPGAKQPSSKFSSNPFLSTLSNSNSSRKSSTSKTPRGSCTNLVLTLYPSVPFACPSTMTNQALCELDAIYSTFNAGENVDSDPSDEDLEAVQIHDVHKVLRSGLELVSFMKNALKD